MANQLPKYANEAERPVCAALVQMLLDEGCAISIFDGEEWVLRRSFSKIRLLNEMAAAESDYLLVESVKGVKFERAGFFSLVYNNGSEYDPMVVIGNWSDSHFCEEIYKQLNAKFGH